MSSIGTSWLEVLNTRLTAVCQATNDLQFGGVRSARSVFVSSTEPSRNSLIVFDFSCHRHHHCHHRFGRRFGIHQKVKSAARKRLKIFGLRPIENGVRASVNP